MKTETSPFHLTSGRLLARNTIWNLLGSGAPMLVALCCIPILIRDLGKDRFGILALAWALVGYANLFDLGLGRALTQMISKKLGAGEHHEVPEVFWTSLLLMTVLGSLGGVIVACISPWLVTHALNVPPSLRHETLLSFYFISLSIPIIIGTAGLRGFLEAQQRFDLINALRVPMGMFTYLGSLLALPFSRSLVPVVAVLVMGRMIAWIAHLLLCFKVQPLLRHRIAWQRAFVRPLMRFGGWMTVSNVIGPLMVTMDRFVIGAYLTVTAVAYYATPFEMVTKLWLFPNSLVGVVFPAFSTSFAHDRNRTAMLYDRSVKYVLLLMFPVVLLIVVLAPDALKLWLGSDFALHSTRVLQWLAVGVFINSLALVPAALLQGIGRPDLTAKLHMIELPAYLLTLWWCISKWGIEGAAMAWTGRVALDAVVLFFLASRLLPAGTSLRPRTAFIAGLAPIALAAATLPQGLALKGAFVLASLTAFAAVAWFLILTPEEKTFAYNYRYQTHVVHSTSSQ
ncbi:MAG: flippase [Candidatus Acidiferrales bacterium]